MFSKNIMKIVMIVEVIVGVIISVVLLQAFDMSGGERTTGYGIVLLILGIIITLIQAYVIDSISKLMEMIDNVGSAGQQVSEAVNKNIDNRLKSMEIKIEKIMSEELKNTRGYNDSRPAGGNLVSGGKKEAAIDLGKKIIIDELPNADATVSLGRKADATVMLDRKKG